jgi:hypothetical protein
MVFFDSSNSHSPILPMNSSLCSGCSNLANLCDFCINEYQKIWIEMHTEEVRRKLIPLARKEYAKNKR